MVNLIEEGVYRTGVKERHARGRRMEIFYLSSLIIAFLVLIVLLFNIVNQNFTRIARTVITDPAELADVPLEELDAQALANIILEERSDLLLTFLYDELSDLPALRDMAGVPLEEALRADVEIPEALRGLAINEGAADEAVNRAELLALNVSEERLLAFVNERIVRERVVEAWNLDQSIFNREAIEAEAAEIERELRASQSPTGGEEASEVTVDLEWYSWFSLDFLRASLNPSNPLLAGVGPAILGSLWIMGLVILISVPLGTGAAIYLQEYASENWFNRLIELNIRNLAGVPSIIYGMLGLAVFVRALGNITSGSTIISAALTLSLLILPIIIIAAQEALRAVPQAIREGSYGLGATKWQTISRQILPTALPGILTGTIIAVSRAVGETAPLLVVGAATFIATNPNSPDDSFTALPMMIYSWTSDPNPQFQNTAAGAIVALLIVLLSMNSFAIILRNRTSKRL